MDPVRVQLVFSAAGLRSGFLPGYGQQQFTGKDAFGFSEG